MDEKVKLTIEKFMIMTELIANAGKKPHNYSTDEDIYRSEIHIMKLIGDYGDLHVSELARKFGVTKGAISQTLKKLERKGLVTKHLDETNNTRLLAELTEKGKKAYLNHEQSHSESDEDMIRFLCELNDNELDTVLTFIEKTCEFAQRHI